MITAETLKPLIDWLVSQGAPLPSRVVETVYFPGGSYEMDNLVFDRSTMQVSCATAEFVKNPTTSLIDLIHAGIVRMNPHAVVPYVEPKAPPVVPPNPTGDTKGRVGMERMETVGKSYSPRRFDQIGFAPVGTTYTTEGGALLASMAGENAFSPGFWLELRPPSA